MTIFCLYTSVRSDRRIYMYYLIGGILFFSLISFVRYLILYHFGVSTKRKTIQSVSYDIGSFIKKCRNKNFQYQSIDSALDISKESKNSRQKLPLTPVISDSVLAGANVFHQYMLIDDYMYEGISKLSGEQIDNFSDLSSKIKDYFHSSNGLTEGSLNKIKGHIAESHVADHFREAGAQVSWPGTSNQEGWDLLLNGSPIQVKLTKDASSTLTEHFKEHPDIPVVMPSDADNIPETAFHFDPSEGVENLMDYLGETSEKAVIANHQLSHAELTENIEQTTDFLTGDIDLFKLPIVTAAFSGFREFNLLIENNTDILSALKNIGLDVAGTGVGMGAGGTAGAALGSIIFPGIGTVVGAIAGSVGGAFFGRNITNEIKTEPLKTAMEDWKKSTKKLKKKIKQTEKEYDDRFKQEKKREQNSLNKLSFEITNVIDEQVKNLRKWIAEKEKPSKSLKTNLLNNIPVTIASIKKEKKLSWTEYFWPKQKTINYQRKMKDIKKFLTEQFQKNTFTDRGQLFQRFSEWGLCREYIFSEIKKAEENRLKYEGSLIKGIVQYQDKLLNQRSESMKKLSDKIKEYVQEIRKELSPYIKEIQGCQNLVKREAKKLGKNVA